jgi:tagatose-1,6-bisphosphate aldolase
MIRPSLTPGKARGLAATSSPEGIFKVLALDHRDSMRVEISPDNPASVPAVTLTRVKMDLLKHLGGEATAVMLEPEYSIAEAIMTRSLPGAVGFLAAVEAQGYLGNPAARRTSLLNGWSVEKAKRVGANAIKLLVLYRPDAGAVTEEQDKLISQVVADCSRYDIPLFLEPLPYRLDGQRRLDSPEFAAIRRRIITETVRRLAPLGPDVLKVPFPIDTTQDETRTAWAEACAELDEASHIPWVLLSGGDPYELFCEQVRIACEAGASGFLAGRALWRDCVAATDEQRARLIELTVLPRFRELARVAVDHGRDWADCFEMESPPERWYMTY